MPSILTTRLEVARTATELLEIADPASLKMSLNGIHLSVVFEKLAAFRGSLPHDIADSLTMRELFRQTKILLVRQEVEGREMSRILAAVSALRNDIPWLEELVPPALEMVPRQVDFMPPQTLCTFVGAIGSLGVASAEAAQAMHLLQRAALSRLDDFAMIDVAVLLWGLADHGEMDEALVEPLATFVRKTASQVTTESATMDLPRIACAFVRLGHWPKPAMREIALRVNAVIPKTRSWSLAALMWSWTHPSAPRQATRRVTLGTPRSRASVIANFVHTLREEVDRRGISQANIERSPLGPKRGKP